MSTPYISTTSPLPNGTVGASYSKTLRAVGGSGPYTWALAAGDLPDGLSLSSSGVLSGVPSTAGVYSFTIEATDSEELILGDSSSGITCSADFTLTVGIGGGGAPVITTSSLPGGVLGVAYSQTVAASGGTAPLYFNITAGALPSGLGINPSTGVIYGTPTAAGTYSFSVTATDAASLTGTAALGIVVANAPVITTSSLPGGYTGAAYSQAVAASGGTAPLSFNITSGALPSGLGINPSTGVISGTPTAAGTYAFDVTATDAASLTGVASLSIVITAAPSGPVITTSSLPGGLVGTAYSQTLATAGGTAPLSFAISSGALPGGVSLNSSTGVISGSPTAAGTFAFNVTVTDAASLTSTAGFSISVASAPTPPSIITPSLPSGTVGVAYMAALATSGGTAPFSFAITSGALPAGLSLNAGTGVISGTPTAPTFVNIIVTVTDSASLTGSATFNLVVYVPSIIPSGVVNPMRASGGMTPVSLVEVLTASNNYYAWSDRDLKNGNAVLAQLVTPIATITATSHPRAGGGAPIFSDFVVALTAPTPMRVGQAATIAGNSVAAFNGNWTVGEVLGPSSYRAYAVTSGGTGTGGTSSTSGGSVNYKGWIIGQPRFALTGTTQTDTGSFEVQNYSGNTVTRDIATAFSRDEFIGAFVYFRLRRADAEYALFTFMGSVSDVSLDDTRMSLSLEGFGNWSAIVAPACDIDSTCPLIFGSAECGSTSSTACQNTYGTCSSIERFKGVITQWNWANQGASLVQIAQPVPVIAHNPARPF